MATTTLYPELMASIEETKVPIQQASHGSDAFQFVHQTQEAVPSTSMQLIINYWTPEDATAIIHALLASFSVIIVSELGDKTFIITAIMAMKNSRALVFMASALALFLMTVMSVVMGIAVTVIPGIYTHYASIVLFLCFGFKMLKEAYDLHGETEDFDEVERNLQKSEKLEEDSLNCVEKDEKSVVNKVVENEKIDQQDDKQAEYGWTPTLLPRLIKTMHVAPIIIKVFTMVFVAEWGDRSQISTVILAAREDTIGVFVGSFVGHLFCTGLAVIGGRFVADMISVRTMTILGGIVFLFFAAFAIMNGPE